MGLMTVDLLGASDMRSLMMRTKTVLETSVFCDFLLGKALLN